MLLYSAVIAIGVNGTAAVIDVFAEAVAAVLQPPVATPPHEVAWDASRGLLAIASHPPSTTSAAPAAAASTTNTQHVRGSAAPKVGAAGPASTLIIWDLHTPSLDSAYGGEAAEAHFAQFLRCLRAHYPHGSGLASQHDASTAIRRSHGLLDHPLASSGHSLSRLSASSNISLGTDATELTFVVSPRTSGSTSHPFSGFHSGSGAPPHNPHLPASLLRQPHFVHGGDPNSPVSSAHNTGFGPMSQHGGALAAVFHTLVDTVSLPGMHVRPVARPAALTLLPSPLKPLQLLQMHVGKIVSEGDGAAAAVAAPLLSGSSRGGSWRSADGRGSAHGHCDLRHAQAAMLCTALALTHRWGLDRDAGAAPQHTARSTQHAGCWISASQRTIY